MVDRPPSAGGPTPDSRLLTKLVVSGRLSFVELVVARVLSVVSAELMVDRPLTVVDRLLSTELLVDRPLPAVDRILPTEPVVDRSPSASSSAFDSRLLTELVVSGRLSFAELVVARVLSVVSAELMVDRLLSTELVVGRPLTDVDRLLSTELLVDRPPSATAPDADSRVVNRATPIYGWPSDTEPRAAKSRRVRVRTHNRGFP